MPIGEVPAPESAAEFKHRMSCCWYGDQRIIHAVRPACINNLQSACGRWVDGDRARRKTGPDVTCPACAAALEALPRDTNVLEPPVSGVLDATAPWRRWDAR